MITVTPDTFALSRTFTISRGSKTHAQVLTVRVTRGGVTIKLWDLGGQPRFRTMWERYCRGVNAVVYVVDAADLDNMDIAKGELHDLLSKPTLAGIPLLVLGNKSDLPTALKETELSDRLDLKALAGREVCCYCISCRSVSNIDITLEWLTKHAKS